MASFRYEEECYGYSGGQSDCSIHAYDGDKKVGHLDIAYHKVKGREEAYIKMIEVDPAYRGKGIGRGLIQHLAQNIPYEAINWGNTTTDGSALKAAMDKAYGTSYKPVKKDEEPDPFDPKYDDDLDNSRFYSDHDAWKKRRGYLDEFHNYPRRGTLMKIRELKKLIRETVKQTLLEAGYDQYGESFMAEEDSVLMKALYEKHIGFKKLVKKLQDQGESEESAKSIAYSIGKKKYGKENMAKVAASGKQMSEKEALDEIAKSLMSAGSTAEDLARKIAQYIADGASGWRAVGEAFARNKDFDRLIPTLDIEGIKQKMLSYDDLRLSRREVEEAIVILKDLKEEGEDAFSN